MKHEVLRLEHISQILDKSQQSCISFSLFKSEALCILTEDLETKLFLLDILQGNMQPDQGKIYVNDRKSIIENLEDAHNLGIFHAHESQLVATMSVAHNLFMTNNAFYNLFSVLKKYEIQTAATKLLAEFSLDHIKPNVTIQSLSMIDRCLMAILYAVASDAKIILLDHSHYNLYQPDEIKKIQKVVSVLKERQISLIWFTNKWEPIFQKFDRFAMIQDGVVTQIKPLTSIPPVVPLKEMLGVRRGITNTINSSVILECKKIICGTMDSPKKVSFSLYEHEILGICDINDDLRSLFIPLSEGIQPKNQEVLLNQKIYHPKLNKKEQIAFIYGDSKHDRIFPHMNLYDNVALLLNKPVYNTFSIMNKRIRNHLARTALESIHAEHLIVQYGSRRNLRGMNQQNQILVEIAKWLCTNPQVFVFINPHEIYDKLPEYQFKTILETLHNLGISIIVISSSEESLSKLCTRTILI